MVHEVCMIHFPAFVMFLKFVEAVCAQNSCTSCIASLSSLHLLGDPQETKGQRDNHWEWEILGRMNYHKIQSKQAPTVSGPICKTLLLTSYHIDDIRCRATGQPLCSYCHCR